MASALRAGGLRARRSAWAGTGEHVAALMVPYIAALEAAGWSLPVLLSQPAVSHHLKILRAARLLTLERRGTLRCYTLNGAELTDLLAPLRELVDQITSCADQPGIHERNQAGTPSAATESSP
ncbi:ArsR/SmtB family transcription factor [Nocardia fusca]|uniref:ArsR family transcriptional regulator n=1 Tax=Nocardia fusca TaxID=941183 RepID=A0ABV3FF10_9NOCA